MRPTTGVPVPTGPSGLAPTQDERLWGLIAHLGLPASLFLGLTWIAPIVAYFAKKDESPFIGFHALQAIYLLIASVVIGIPTCGVGAVVCIVFAVIAAIRAYGGELYEVPVVGKWARQRVFGS